MSRYGSAFNTQVVEVKGQHIGAPDLTDGPGVQRLTLLEEAGQRVAVEAGVDSDDGTVALSDKIEQISGGVVDLHHFGLFVHLISQATVPLSIGAARLPGKFDVCAEVSGFGGVVIVGCPVLRSESLWLIYRELRCLRGADGALFREVAGVGLQETAFAAASNHYRAR